ncbi:MAG: hypothetical protein DWQ08_14580 [Proteobacteria bacterium]|nr:MAG: hypothetical protein DWQ08_14580 [Pseudomonadota bacterium]
MRTRSKWRNTKPVVSHVENATALAYICWQISLDRAKNLHQQDYDYSGDEQRTGVIAEYLCFLVHIADRMIYSLLDESDRETFVGTLARHVARHYQRNLEDVFGRGRDYRSDFIDKLNERGGEYANYTFDDNKPGYQMLRGLGRHVQDVMGESQTNRWVIDQIMELDAPEALLEFEKAMDNLFGTARVMDGFSAPE